MAGRTPSPPSGPVDVSKISKPVPKPAGKRPWALIGGAVGAVAIAAAAAAFFLIPRTGSLLVEVTPPDAQILVNGEAIDGSSPFLKQDIPQGETLTIQVKKDGYREVRQSITIKAGVRTKIPVTLTKEAPPPPAAQYGFLRVTSTPSGAKVLLKGQDTGLVTPCQLNLAPGVPYELTFEMDGKPTKRGSYRVTANEQKAIAVDFSQPGELAPDAVVVPADGAGISGGNGTSGGAPPPTTAGPATTGTQGAAPAATQDARPARAEPAPPGSSNSRPASDGQANAG